MPNQEPHIEPAAGADAPEHAATPRRSAATHETAVQAPALAYEPEEEEEEEEDSDWLDEPEELPRRPRRRLLAPIPIALVIVLLTACGFIGGVLVEKGQGSSGSSSGTGASALASRFAALRGGSAAGAKSGASAGGASAASSLFGGSASSSGAAGAGAGATTGQVAYIQGSTLYVTTSEGNTVKVDTSPASTVTKTVKADVSSIRPGETVLVTGAAGTNGTVSAESIRVGASGGGGLAGLFGRSRGGSSTGGSTGGGSSSGGGGGGGGEPALFGKGG
jgi:hypothetical protein